MRWGFWEGGGANVCVNRAHPYEVVAYQVVRVEDI
jgi:hypothetical protein